jgi:hypothetical protein
MRELPKLNESKSSYGGQRKAGERDPDIVSTKRSEKNNKSTRVPSSIADLSDDYARAETGDVEFGYGWTNYE